MKEPATVWDLAKISEKRRLMDQIQKLPKGLYEVLIKPRKLTRSLNANRYYFAACVAPFAEWLRENYGDTAITSEQAHEMLVVAVLGWDERHSEKTGKTLKFRPQTHSMDSAEFAEYVDKAAAWLAEVPEIIVLPPELFLESKTQVKGSVVSLREQLEGSLKEVERRKVS